VTTTVHIIDDDEAVRDSVKILLESHDISVRTYSSGEEFLAGFSGPVNDCLLLDVNMPGMSGLEVLEVVGARWSGLPVVLITGRSENLRRARARTNDSVGLLEKPFTEADLLTAIRRVSRAPAA